MFVPYFDPLRNNIRPVSRLVLYFMSCLTCKVRGVLYNPMFAVFFFQSGGAKLLCANSRPLSCTHTGRLMRSVSYFYGGRVVSKTGGRY